MSTLLGSWESTTSTLVRAAGAPVALVICTSYARWYLSSVPGTETSAG
ncbi:hypothetical protein [Mycobacterium ulcerans]|uniref:Uncharacterized protein n=1 Tax=Mycobacterium ulcerans TaxID=1809 RepID=A0ABY5TS94_MYCUL|nr:hypothetical protein [Mycobacterium ulcerans]UDM32965.1 hypothetical protein LH162_14330 [Mycobacterium ulcerans]UVY89912.1 hypothetical protein MJO63_25945 [Mycobacterium ulcerans]